MPFLQRPRADRRRGVLRTGTDGSGGTGYGFLHNAINTVFKGYVAMSDHSVNINVTQKGKSTLEILRTAMDSGAKVHSSTRHPPPRCHAGTRTTLIRHAQEWLLDTHRNWDIFWLDGPAGVGKSAVAQTIAELAEELRQLGAAFFFSRKSKTEGKHDDAQRDNKHGDKRDDSHDTQPIFATIAYQLGVKFPGYLPLVAKQLAADPGLLDDAPHVQFDKLIVEPLRLLQSRNPQKYLVILDGLDECRGKKAQLDIVKMINNVTLSQTSLPVIWMICTRPESHLEDTFFEGSNSVRCLREELAIDDAEAREDTARFIRSRFEEIHRKNRNYVDADGDGNWPPTADVDYIIAETSGLFVYASSIMDYIEDSEFGSPSARLAEVLTTMKDSHLDGERRPMKVLDDLYTEILSKVRTDIWPTTHRLLKIAVDRLLPIRENTPQFLSNLLGVTSSQFYTALRDLHSVLEVPSPDDADKRPMRPFHSSFRAYLSHPARSGRFCISLPPDLKVNDELQKASLRIIASLVRSRNGSLGQGVQTDQLKKCLTWPSLNGSLDRKFAEDLALATSSLIFRSYSACNSDHRELESMLRDFDFNCLAFLSHDQSFNWMCLPGFIYWTKRKASSLQDLVRTSSANETDNQLLSHVATARPDADPLDLDHVLASQSFGKVPKLRYFILGYEANAVLVFIGGAEPTKVSYHSILSENNRAHGGGG